VSYDGPIEYYVGGSPEGAFLPRHQRRAIKKALFAGLEETPQKKRERLEAEVKDIVDKMLANERKESPCSSSSIQLPGD
jgi:hypothetical protein